MTDLIERAKEALENATPGPWDEGRIGFVHKQGVLHPVKPDESRVGGESWIEMRHRISPQIEAREIECQSNARLTALSYDLARALIREREAANRLAAVIECAIGKADDGKANEALDFLSGAKLELAALRAAQKETQHET